MMAPYRLFDVAHIYRADSIVCLLSRRTVTLKCASDSRRIIDLSSRASKPDIQEVEPKEGSTVAMDTLGGPGRLINHLKLVSWKAVCLARRV